MITNFSPDIANQGARVAEKSNYIVDKFDTSDYVTGTGFTDLGDKTIGIYNPDNGKISINPVALGTEKEDESLIHENIHGLQVKEMSESDIDLEDFDLYQQALLRYCMEAQASLYNPGDEAYSDRFGAYEEFMNYFMGGESLPSNILDAGKSIYGTILETEDGEKIVSISAYSPEELENLLPGVKVKDSQDLLSKGDKYFQEVAELLGEVEDSLEEYDLEELRYEELPEIDEEFDGYYGNPENLQGDPRALEEFADYLEGN